MSLPLSMPPERAFIEEDMPYLLERITEGTPALWGKMSAQQMIEHLESLFLLSANPDNGLSISVPAERLPKALAWLESEKQFRPNTIAPILPETPLPCQYDSIDRAKSNCLLAADKYAQAWRNQPEMTIIHPVFGRLTRRQWDRFHWKHLQHHFRQFGLLPIPSNLQS